jgi:septal ring factor EnvC (AmiA/AmiB activator)
MGKQSRKRRMDGSPVDWKPLDIIEDIDFGSLSLEAFAAGDKGSASSSIVQGYSAHSVDEYNRERDRFEDLHSSITACDQVLKSVETYLTGFQADLGAVSSEIETLQSKSAAMNSNLENRRVVEKLLGPAVEDISLSPAIVKKISEEQIDEGWVKALAELEKRCKVVETRAKEDKKMKAIHDLKPLLDDLIAKV